MHTVKCKKTTTTKMIKHILIISPKISFQNSHSICFQK